MGHASLRYNDETGAMPDGAWGGGAFLSVELQRENEPQAGRGVRLPTPPTHPAC
ncbi:unnamed protein product, partial [Ectocarpus sp. 8 AP-2014]